MERMYRVDQDVLDERGIGLSVEEVVGLSTAEYAVRLRRLNLSAVDAAFVKSLRRRIKNRMASQNSRRRTAEHIRSLSDELRAVRASKDDVLEERSALSAERARLAAALRRLGQHVAEMASQNSRRRTAEHIRSLSDELRAVRASKDDVLEERSALSAERARLAAALRRLGQHVAEKLKERGDESEMPFTLTPTHTTSHVFQENCISTSPKYNITLSQPYIKQETDLSNDVEKEKSIFECRLESLVQRSVSHMYKFERHKLNINTLQIDACKKTSSVVEICEQADPPLESVDVNDESEPKDLISDMVKLNSFAAEMCKPKNVVMDISSGSVKEVDNTNHEEEEIFYSKNLSDTYSTKDVSEIDNAKGMFQTKSSITDKRKSKHIGYPTIKLMTETHRKKNIIDIFKIPPKDPIVPEVPKIIRAKCVTIACDDAKEELNARKPRRRNKEAALREAKQATFRQIMEATYKEINGGSVKEINRVRAKDVKESPFKDENEVAENNIHVSDANDFNGAPLREVKEISFSNMNDKSLEDGHEFSVNGTNGVTDTKSRFERVREAMLREARATPKNGCIVHTSDEQYKEAGVLNLSVRGERRHHGRKQAAPRRIACAPPDYDDAVLDLKIKRDGL